MTSSIYDENTIDIFKDANGNLVMVNKADGIYVGNFPPQFDLAPTFVLTPDAKYDSTNLEWYIDLSSYKNIGRGYEQMCYFAGVISRDAVSYAVETPLDDLINDYAHFFYNASWRIGLSGELLCLPDRISISSSIFLEDQCVAIALCPFCSAGGVTSDFNYVKVPLITNGVVDGFTYKIGNWSNHGYTEHLADAISQCP